MIAQQSKIKANLRRKATPIPDSPEQEAQPRPTKRRRRHNKVEKSVRFDESLNQFRTLPSRNERNLTSTWIQPEDHHRIMVSTKQTLVAFARLSVARKNKTTTNGNGGKDIQQHQLPVELKATEDPIICIRGLEPILFAKTTTTERKQIIRRVLQEQELQRKWGLSPRDPFAIPSIYATMSKKSQQRAVNLAVLDARSAK